MKRAVNWNELDQEIYKTFWDQNVRQFWVDEEIPVSEDKEDWNGGKISQVQKDTYEKVLAGLTLLDTIQGGEGMPNIGLKIDNLHAKSIFSFMAMMEQMHAKSYSTIFSTLSTTQRINELFEWISEDEILQKKAHLITKYYENIDDEEDLYFSLCSSVMLETFLFYSGFYYPLWFAGQGLLVHSGEIIALIIRDESIHGVFTGIIAQQELDKISVTKHQKIKDKVMKLMLELFEIEKEYTKQLYKDVGLEEEVITFVKYNADKALMNLGYDSYFNVGDEDINPIIFNGLNTETKNHDFFSTKGNGYIKTTNVEPITDDIFDI